MKSSTWLAITGTLIAFFSILVTVFSVQAGRVFSDVGYYQYVDRVCRDGAIVAAFFIEPEEEYQSGIRAGQTQWRVETSLVATSRTNAVTFEPDSTGPINKYDMDILLWDGRILEPGDLVTFFGIETVYTETDVIAVDVDLPVEDCWVNRIAVAKTVSASSDICSNETNFAAMPGDQIYYCVSIQNDSIITQTQHTINDPLLGIDLDFTYALGPKGSGTDKVFVTNAVLESLNLPPALGPVTVTDDMTNTVTYSASNTELIFGVDLGETFSVTGTAVRGGRYGRCRGKNQRQLHRQHRSGDLWHDERSGSTGRYGGLHMYHH